jgi:hypothetical protein
MTLSLTSGSRAECAEEAPLGRMTQWTPTRDEARQDLSRHRASRWRPDSAAPVSRSRAGWHSCRETAPSVVRWRVPSAQ